jgi:FkbM family methyltransferase
MTFYSQDNQDKFLETNIFKGFKNGVFVDVGAHDGVSINNTYYFEKNNGWTGINVEPMKEIYDKLVVNRPACVNLNYAIHSKEGVSEFICNTGYTEMISGLKDTFHDRHYERLQHELNKHGGTSEVISVDTRRLDSILQEHNIKHVHYLSIDVEGAEFEVIKSINYEDVFIDVIDFENNYDEASVPIIEFLVSKGYVQLKLPFWTLDIYMIHKDSQFVPSL